jgi:hypothetical protein
MRSTISRCRSSANQACSERATTGPTPSTPRAPPDGRHDGVQRAELPGDVLRGGRADVPDRQADEQPPRPAGPRGLDAAQDLLDLLRPKPRSPSKDSAVRWKTSPTSRRPAGLQQRDGGLVAQAVDVHRAAAGEVEHRLPQLRRAGDGVGAADVDLALGPAELGAALGAVRRHDELAHVAGRAARAPGRRPRG